MKSAIALRGGIHTSHICSKLFQKLEKWTFQEPQPWAEIKINQSSNQSLSTFTHMSRIKGRDVIP